MLGVGAFDPITSHGLSRKSPQSTISVRLLQRFSMEEPEGCR
jgi:hypothetical protein